MNFVDILAKNNKITNFFTNPPGGSRVYPCGRSDGHDEANSHFSLIL